MTTTFAKLPDYLKRYCVEQNSAKYSPRDHAAWRYIMRQSRAYFKDHALPIYLEGLEKTGITSERIPSIAAMDRKLQEFGWGAVPVEGFIPPAAFLDFQARRVLPIASDMRSVEHIAYTPAPDIVHEAAGHAPIIADPAYSDYLMMYAAMAQKAIFSQEDLDVYEAIRRLSDVKENPDCTSAMIQDAEAALLRANAAVQVISEANKVARMNWWTVEYGLLGSLAAPKIYGAGLLSSISESQNCLSPKVKKHRLSLACVDTSYNITEPQPQLFVAEDLPHLVHVLKDFEQTLAYRRGGAYGLEQAQKGRTVTTTVLDSGLQISGKLAQVMLGESGAPRFLQWSGPVQLGHGDRELPGQGVAQHPQGFSTPLGRAARRPEQALTHLTDAQLRELGLRLGERCELQLTSGFHIAGQLAEFGRQGSRLLFMKWRECTVTCAGQAYFQPAWGDFDMAVGEEVPSVFGGPLDRERYGSHDVGTATTSPARTSPYTQAEEAAFAAYLQVAALRQELAAGAEALPKATAGGGGEAVVAANLIAGDKTVAAANLVAGDKAVAAANLAASHSVAATAARARAQHLAQETAAAFPQEWLLRLETVELVASVDPRAASPLARQLSTDVQQAGADIRWLVSQGVALLPTAAGPS